MADDGQNPQDDQQKLPPGSLPGSAFQPPPTQAGQRSLPGYFFNLPPGQQRDFLATPGRLPSDLPEQTLKTVGRAAPYIGATAAALATPEFSVPAGIATRLGPFATW